MILDAEIIHCLPMHKHDFPLMLALMLQTMCFSRLFDWHSVCNDGRYRFFSDKLQKFLFVLWRGMKCTRANDMHFFEAGDLCINSSFLTAEVADEDNTSILCARFDTCA